jgi:S1-C subfamily serine protease
MTFSVQWVKMVLIVIVSRGGFPIMSYVLRNAIRLLVVASLLLTSMVGIALAQDETDTATATPFVGIRFAGADDGVLVTGIVSNTPAETAGLQVLDIITAMDGYAVDVVNVRDAVMSFDVDETITLSLIRNQQELEIDLTLMARPVDLFANPYYWIPLDPASLGMVVANTPDGLIITSVMMESPAHVVGLRLADYITHINGQSINTDLDATIAMADLRSGDEVSFSIKRGQEIKIIKFVIPEYSRKPVPPRQRPSIESIYNSDNVTLGYGGGIIFVSKLGETHELYLAGVREGDYIIALNGQEISQLRDLFAADTFQITIDREGNFTNLDVPVTIAPLMTFGVDVSADASTQGVWLGLHEKQVTLGVRYIQLDEETSQVYNAEVTDGAFIAEVIEGLPAYDAGLQVGDVILAINDEAVTVTNDLRTVIYTHRPGDVVTVKVARGTQVLDFEVSLRVANS